jgi:hypothetical protein
MVARPQLILRGSSLSNPITEVVATWWDPSGIQRFDLEPGGQTPRPGGDADNKRIFIAGF